MDIIDVDDFLNACSRREIEQVIDYLVETGHVKRNEVLKVRRADRICIPEQIFNTHLEALRGKWNRLSNDEEQMIMDISKKFV